PWSICCQPVWPVRSRLLAKSVIKLHVDLAWPSSQFRQRRIDDNGGQPCRHFRLPLELVQMPASGEECILDRILSVGSIAQVSIRPFVKQRHAPREDVLHLLSSFFEDADI